MDDTKKLAASLIAAGALAAGALLFKGVEGGTTPPPAAVDCRPNEVRCTRTKTCAPSCAMCVPEHHC